MKLTRYCAGNICIDSEGTHYDFYYDTQFLSYDEAVEFANGRELTHIYDTIEDVYIEIGKEQDESPINKYFNS